jgi:S1-C subfamily serine protease
MFRPDKLGLIGFVIIFALSFIFQGHDKNANQYGKDSVSKRRPPSSQIVQEQRRPQRVLPPISQQDPVLKLAPSQKGNSTGTAFSIGPGSWMTARHVVEGCKKFGIAVGGKRIEKGFNVNLNPYHDLATFETRRIIPALGFEKEPLKIGQAAFHFGYPQGKPAAIHSVLLGRVKINPGRRTRHTEPVIAWAESRRAPNFSGSLGGISGGPVMDQQGDIIGVSVVEVRRRGRILTSAPKGIKDMLARAGNPEKEQYSKKVKPDINTRQFEKIGRDLRQSLSVSKVLCWVN